MHEPYCGCDWCWDLKNEADEYEADRKRKEMLEERNEE